MDKYIETKAEALLRVGRANKEDYCKIFDFASDWVKKQFKVFDANDFRKDYLAAGNKMPDQRNIIGAVFNNLAKEELMFQHGSKNSTTPESRGCLIRTWISLEYKQRQKSNASNKNNLKLEL